MVRAYLNVRATGGAVFFLLRRENTRERWSPFKVEGDGGCSKRSKMDDVRSKRLPLTLNWAKGPLNLELGLSPLTFGLRPLNSASKLLPGAA